MTKQKVQIELWFIDLSQSISQIDLSLIQNNLQKLD